MATYSRTLSSQLTDVLAAMRKQAGEEPTSILAHIDDMGRAYHAARDEVVQTPQELFDPASECDMTQ